MGNGIASRDRERERLRNQGLVDALFRVLGQHRSTTTGEPSPLADTTRPFPQGNRFLRDDPRFEMLQQANAGAFDVDEAFLRDMGNQVFGPGTPGAEAFLREIQRVRLDESASPFRAALRPHLEGAGLDPALADNMDPTQAIAVFQAVEAATAGMSKPVISTERFVAETEVPDPRDPSRTITRSVPFEKLIAIDGATGKKKHDVTVGGPFASSFGGGGSDAMRLVVGPDGTITFAKGFGAADVGDVDQKTLEQRRGAKQAEREHQDRELHRKMPNMQAALVDMHNLVTHLEETDTPQGLTGNAIVQMESFREQLAAVASLTSPSVGEWLREQTATAVGDRASRAAGAEETLLGEVSAAIAMMYDPDPNVPRGHIEGVRRRLAKSWHSGDPERRKQAIITEWAVAARQYNRRVKDLGLPPVPLNPFAPVSEGEASGFEHGLQPGTVIDEADLDRIPGVRKYIDRGKRVREGNF